MWAFRKLPEDLRPEERQVLRKLWQVAPKLKLAYDLRRQLTAIFEQRIATSRQAQDPGLDRTDPKKWTEVFRRVHQDPEVWWEEITNYFVNRASSGFVEGLNNKLKV